jgi:ATP-dependent Clp protease, protease subunit
MPVGVPKVAYRVAEDQPADWIDLYNCLYRERFLFMCQDLNEELSNQLIGIMLYLNAEERDDDVYLYINSLGGAITSGIGLYDVMNFIDSDVTTICIGTSASIASFVLMGGAVGKRTALPNARVMIHQPSGGSDGQTASVLSEAEEMVRLRDDLVTLYAQRTGQPPERIKEDLGRDIFMSAREARKYGLVDAVAISY